MKHPAEVFIKYLIIRNPQITDAELLYNLAQWSFLRPIDDNYLGLLRQRIPAPPQTFNPYNQGDRDSMRYLRDQEIYELFWPNAGMEEAYSALTDPEKRMLVEQLLLSRLDLKIAVQRINRKLNWMMTVAGLEMYRHCFWNVKLLTFDEWGTFLYGRTAMYERFMSLLQGDPKLAFFHLRLEQTLESKKMIQRAQEIAYFTLEEVAQIPGVRSDKIKAIGVLGKTIVDCHQALSTSDMALKDVLKQFERFRMEHGQKVIPSIDQIAPKGNFTGSGAELPAPEEDKKVH